MRSWRSTGRNTMPTPYSPGCRKRETEAASSPAGKKRVRNLNEDTRPITGLRIATASPAMREVDEDLHAFQYNVVRFLALNIGHEANTASVMLVLRAGINLAPEAFLEMGIRSFMGAGIPPSITDHSAMQGKLRPPESVTYYGRPPLSLRHLRNP